MEACAVICRKATVALPEANFLFPWCQSPSSRAQNRHFCALLPSGTPVFGHFEHKIGVFVSETAIFPWICPLPSTKSAFLCSKGGESGIRKCNRGDAYPSCKSPRTLPKCKYLITKQLTFAFVLGEHKLVAPSTLPLARSACGGTQRGR